MQLPAQQHQPVSMGATVMCYKNRLWLGILFSVVSTVYAQSLPPGLIASDPGGASGYQHELKQSHFVIGEEARAVTESGWSRQIGPTGVFATSLHNGVVMALPNAHAEAAQASRYGKDAAQHNEEVLKYFIAAGIPKNQIGGVHTMTRLSGSGHE